MSKIIAPILAAIGDVLLTPTKPPEILLPHKKRVKGSVTSKQPKPGKNKPAKGYDPETKTWVK